MTVRVSRCMQSEYPSALGKMAETKALLCGKRLAIFLDYDGEMGGQWVPVHCC